MNAAPICCCSRERVGVPVCGDGERLPEDFAGFRRVHERHKRYPCTGTSDSSSAFNAAITAAGTAGTYATALDFAASARDSARRAPVTILGKLHHDHLHRPDRLLAT
jgi:hypothetical protein